MADKIKKPKPDTKSAYAEMMTTRWDLADALMGGSEAMRDAGDVFLPQHKNEDEDEYTNRIARSFLLPIFAQAVENLVDTVFSDPLTWDEGIPPELEEMLEEVDAEGNDIENFAKQMLSMAMAKGEVYVIADAPPLPTPAQEGAVVSLADVRNTQGGGRPYLALISADNMLDFKVTKRGGRVYCTYARWRESEYVTIEDDFGDMLVERVFEWKIDDDGAAIWRKFERFDGEGEWAETEGTLSIAYDGKALLPMIRFRIGNVDSFGRLLPPLHGLAEKNVEHWQSSSDQRAILTVSRFPMLGGSGVDTDELDKDGDGKRVIGPNVTLFSRHENSKFYYVEPQGHAIKAGETDLDRLEKDMSVLAFQPLMRQQAGVTATKDALGQNKANCSLQSWSIALGQALDDAVELLSIWKRTDPPEINFKPNTEFGIETIDQVRVTALQAMRNGGDISRPQYLKQMKRERVLDEEFDEEANEVELESEGPAITTDPLTGLPIQVPGTPNMDPPNAPPKPDDKSKPDPKAA